MGLTLEDLLNATRCGQPSKPELDSGTALQAYYGYRLVERSNYALYGEVHFLANPQRKVATIFLTPGLRVKLFPRKAVAPYFAVCAGDAASRELSRGGFDFGGGVDVGFWRFIGLRAEIHDFYSGSPAYNPAAFRGGQHNVVADGGLVLRFH